MTLQINPSYLENHHFRRLKGQVVKPGKTVVKVVKSGQVDWLKVVKSGTRLRNSGVVKLNLRLPSKG